MSFKISFYQWCIQNNHKDFLDRWDYALNKEDPDNISASSINKYYFLCENKEHPSELHQIHPIIRFNRIPKCSVCNSFGYWCEHNNRMDLLNRWDYELNKISPYNISISSTKKQYFKCPKGIHISEEKDLNNIRKQYGSSRCSQCESIGQYGIDNVDPLFLENYWSNKNTDLPHMVSKYSNKKIWIKCQNKDYHEDYQVSCVNFLKGERCPFCSKKKINKIDSLGFIYNDKVQSIWSELNDLSPYDYFPQSNKLVYWKCDNDKHQDYRRSISQSLRADFKCPKCIKERKESVLQEKVRLYISSLYDDINHEYDCTLLPRNPKTNYIMPYDNEIVKLKLIIEVHGQQHYSKNSFNGYFGQKNISPEQALNQRKEYDAFKKEYALSHDYYYLEIPYWTDDKKETWKILINNKIQDIVSI